MVAAQVAKMAVLFKAYVSDSVMPILLSLYANACAASHTGKINLGSAQSYSLNEIDDPLKQGDEALTRRRASMTLVSCKCIALNTLSWMDSIKIKHGQF